MLKKKNLLVISLVFLLLLGLYWGLGTKNKISETDFWQIVDVPDNTQSLNSQPEKGFPAPDFTWTDAQGKEVKLSDLKGKPVFINFWATWCPPCRAEMPDIQKFYEKTNKEVTVLAVNLTYSEKSEQDIAQFISEGGYTFPILLDQKGLLAQKYLIRAIPTSFFIDDQGVIRNKYTGALNIEKINSIIADITE